MPGRPRPTPQVSHSPTSPAINSRALFAWHPAWIFALLVVLVFVAYLPALSGTLLWDDTGHVTRADLRSLGGLWRIWTVFGATQQFYPVLHSAFWFEHLLWGDATVGYHLVNGLLHATTAFLFGMVLQRLALPGAWLAALLFALHPVCVESVAWISEQKNTLSSAFYLGAALVYLRFDAERRAKLYAWASTLFLLALLTKTVTATLPAALLVIFWWQRGRLDWRRDVVPLLPWFALGAASGLVTAHFERELIGAQGADFDLSLVQRCLLAGRVFWFYLAKLAWPDELIFIYPRWTVNASAPSQWLFPLGLIALLSGLVWWQRRSRSPLAAALLFGGTLFPVLGFVNVFPFLFSYVADHFQYLASLPVFALAAAGLWQILPRLPAMFRAAAIGALLSALGILTWVQSGMYRNQITLYETTLRQNPAAWLAHNNLATVLTLAGRSEEAIPHLEAALKLNPGMAQAYSNLGDNLTRLGRAKEAIPHLEKALQLQPDYAVAHGNLGNALLELNRLDEAISHFREAIRLAPKYSNAECNLGLALAHAGRTLEAIAHFERSVQLEPTYADAELNWAIGLMLTDRFPDAVPHFERAIQLNPASADFHDTYGRALERADQLPAAISHFETALRLDPEYGAAHLHLSLALRRLGRPEEAERHRQAAARLGAVPP